MRTKYIVAALVVAASVAGTAWAFNTTKNAQVIDGQAPVASTEVKTIETDNCCLTGDCCCPGQGACCDLTAKAKAATSGVKYVKKAGAGCCATGNCCCPGAGSCCASSATSTEGKSCCSDKANKKECCKE
jgi:hypothetical protein